ncbi:MAG TPA: choice-of-anchor tandem repeat GloVer-containing protein [Rhizomicrobium sp.]
MLPARSGLLGRAGVRHLCFRPPREGGGGRVFQFLHRQGAADVAEGDRACEGLAHCVVAGDVRNLHPAGGLIDVKGTLYGTTVFGGTYGDGTIFSLNPKTNAEAALWSFGNGTDGQNPESGLIDVKGALYGTTLFGGAYGSGTVFSVVP